MSEEKQKEELSLSQEAAGQLKALALGLGSREPVSEEASREEIEWARGMISRLARKGLAKEAEELARDVPAALLERAPARSKEDESRYGPSEHAIFSAARLEDKDAFAALSRALCDLTCTEGDWDSERSRDARALFGKIPAGYISPKSSIASLQAISELLRSKDSPSPLLAAFARDDAACVAALLEDSRVGPSLLRWGSEAQYPGESLFRWALELGAARCARLLIEVEPLRSRDFCGLLAEEMDLARRPQRRYQESYNGVGLDLFDKIGQAVERARERAAESFGAGREPWLESARILEEVALRAAQTASLAMDKPQEGTGMRWPEMACVRLEGSAAGKVLAALSKRGFPIDWASCAEDIGQRAIADGKSGEEARALSEWILLEADSAKASVGKEKKTGARGRNL